MRFLHVIRSVDPKGGGPIEGLRQRGAVLTEMGMPPEILSADDPSAEFLRDFPLKVHAVGPAPGTFGRTTAMRDWIRAHHHEYDVVTAHGIWQYPPLAVHAALKGTNTPYFVFIHGMLDPWFDLDRVKRLKKQLFWWAGLSSALRDAAFVMFTTEEERRLAHNRFQPYRVNERVVAYGTNGAPSDLAGPRAVFEQAFPALAGKPFLLFLSRIHPKKGCDLLVEAFAREYADSDVLLVLAGPDQVGQQAALEEQARSLGVFDRVRFVGMLQGELKWGAYAACEAFVLPSHQENFGIVVAEALSAGRPALISDKVNIWREVAEGGGGIVAPDDLAGTRELLRHWRETSPESRAEMGRRARLVFEEKFSARQSAESLLEAAREVLSRR